MSIFKPQLRNQDSLLKHYNLVVLMTKKTTLRWQQLQGAEVQRSANCSAIAVWKKMKTEILVPLQRRRNKSSKFLH